ncbi:hypothetical protein E2542_SST23560 [Spatholobus suberectus]|nr:hypothetical protein E2542_SST23560 [Spatholobus suberectus]
MRAGGSWEASRYVHYAPAVVDPKGSAYLLPVATPSIATFPIDLLASVPSPLKPVIALNAIFNYFSCNFPSGNPNVKSRILGLIIIFHLSINILIRVLYWVRVGIGQSCLSYKPATFVICLLFAS